MDNTVIGPKHGGLGRNNALDLEETFRTAENTTIRFYGTYLNAKYKDFCNGYYAVGNASRPQFPACATDPALVDLSGNRLSNAPKYTVAAFVDQRFNLGNSGFLDVSADINLQDEVFFTEFNNNDARQEAFALVNASITYHSPDERWSLALWGKNLTDKYALANTIIAAPLYSFVSVGSLRPPRTYGVTLGVDF